MTPFPQIQPSSSIASYFSHKPSCQLSDLLPLKAQNNVCKALKEYSLLLNALLKTIKKLEKGKFSQFDALVGENLCQLRALINTENIETCLRSLIPKKEKVEKRLNNINILINHIDKKINFSNYGSHNLKDLLAKEKLEICLTENERLMVEFFLLTIVKKEDGFSEITKLPNLTRLADVNCNFQDALIKKIRSRISKISARLLRSLAFEYGDIESFSMLEKKHILKIEQRKCPPTYPVTKVILKAILVNEIPIVLIIKQCDEEGNNIKQFCIYYKTNYSKTSFDNSTPYLTDAKKPVIIIEGISTRDGLITPNEILSHNLEVYLKYHGASHRQYPPLRKPKDIELNSNKKEESLAVINNDIEFQKDEEKAYQIGATKDNPSLFYIRHIFCDQLENTWNKTFWISDDLEFEYREREGIYSTMKLKRIGEICNLDLKVTIDKTIGWIDGHLPSLPHIFWEICYTHCKENFVFASKKTGLNDEVYWIDYADCLNTFINPLELSRCYKNPIKFLMDFRSEWLENNTKFVKKPTNLKEIIEFITDKPEYFKEAGVIDFLADLIQASLRNRICNPQEMEAVITGLEKALHIPEVKNEALRLLLYAGSKHQSCPLIYLANWYQSHRRSEARKVLKKFIDIPQIRLKLKLMMIDEPILNLKMDLLNMLEGDDLIANQLESGEIISNISMSWNINNYLLELMKIPDKKTCVPQWNNFKTIIDTAFFELLDLIENAVDKQQRIVAIRYLANYFTLYTDRFNMDDYKDILHESFEYKEKSKDPLMDILGDEFFNFTTEPSQIFQVMSRHDQRSIRYYRHRLYKVLKEAERRLMESILVLYIRRQQGFRQIIFSFLSEFINNNLNDASLRSEASSLLFMIIENLKNVYDSGLPTLIPREELEAILQDYEKSCHFIPLS